MGRLLVGAAVWPRKNFMERVDALVDAGVDLIVVDTAHDHQNRLYRRNRLKKNILM